MTLYKYLTPNLKIILDSQEIRFTQPELFNDPFESFPFIQQLIAEAKFDDLITSRFPEYDTDTCIKENIATTLKEKLPSLTSEEKAKVENNMELVNDVKLQFADLISVLMLSSIKQSLKLTR